MTTIEAEQGELPGMPDPLPPPAPQPFLVRGEVEQRVDVEVDLAALIHAYPEEYRQVDMTGGFQAWERPMRFLEEFLIEDAGGGMLFGQHVAVVWEDDTEFREQGRWTEQRFAELVLVCPEAADA